jgi:hypothetical protein
MALSHQLVSKLLSYDPETGVMHWLEDRGRLAKKGYVAGAKDDKGYIRLMLCGKKYRAHQLAFVLMGEQYPAYVDHINGDRSDNRWSNLRVSDPLNNAKNMRKRKDGNTPFTGVGYMKSHNKWRVRLNHQGESVYIGIYGSLFEAISARESANRKYGFHENHGSTL